MKASSKFLCKNPLVFSLWALTLLEVSAWSPPTGENVLVNPGSVQVRNGIIDVRTATSSGNTTGTAPAVIIGSGNDIVRNGITIPNPNELGRGIVVGGSNTLSCPSYGYSAVIGSSNNAVASNSIIVGSTNTVSYIYDPLTAAAITYQNSTRNSVISGYSNTIGYDSENLLVGGKLNTVHAYASLISGVNNSVGDTTVGDATTPPGIIAYNSAAIGQNNAIITNYGWTMGYSNVVSGSRGVAIGSGLYATNAQSTALGRFNATMQTNDVLVVGTGTSDTARSTALRITSDGGVILGRAQGDIPMFTGN